MSLVDTTRCKHGKRFSIFLFFIFRFSFPFFRFSFCVSVFIFHFFFHSHIFRVGVQVYQWMHSQTLFKLEFILSAQFSGLTVTFSFQRRWIYYVYQVYVPCICITVLSWIGFWIDHKAVPARTGLGITTVLTMVYMLASVNSNLPRVTYLKSIDNFVLVCFGFIFLTSLEYVIAIRFSQNRKAANDRKTQKVLSQNLSVSSGNFLTVHIRSYIIPRYTLGPVV